VDRLLLLLPTTTYRTEDFVDAATALGVDLICASEAPSTFEALAPDNLLTLDFADPDGAAAAVARFVERRPIGAVVGVDDRTTVAAAAIAARLDSANLPPRCRRPGHHARAPAAAGIRQPARLFRWRSRGHGAALDYPCVVAAGASPVAADPR
jgi:hypothetical protein